MKCNSAKHNRLLQPDFLTVLVSVLERVADASGVIHYQHKADDPNIVGRTNRALAAAGVSDFYLVLGKLAADTGGKNVADDPKRCAALIDAIRSVVVNRPELTEVFRAVLAKNPSKATILAARSEYNRRGIDFCNYFTHSLSTKSNEYRSEVAPILGRALTPFRGGVDIDVKRFKSAVPKMTPAADRAAAKHTETVSANRKKAAEKRAADKSKSKVTENAKTK